MNGYHKKINIMMKKTKKKLNKYSPKMLAAITNIAKFATTSVTKITFILLCM